MENDPQNNPLENDQIVTQTPSINMKEEVTKKVGTEPWKDSESSKNIVKDFDSKFKKFYSKFLLIANLILKSDEKNQVSSLTSLPEISTCGDP